MSVQSPATQHAHEAQVIRSQKLLVLSRASPMVVLTTAILLALVFIASWGSVPSALLLGWLGIYSLALLGRLLLLLAFRRIGSHTQRWLLLFRASAALNGLLMGVGCWVLYRYAEPALGAFLIVTAVGATFAAMSAHTVDPPTAIAYVCLALPPVLACTVGDFTVIGWATTAMILGGVSYLMLDRSRRYSNLVENILLRVRATEDAQALIEAQAELVVARDEARALASAKSRILANMSHEMRSPLAAILGFSERALHSDASASALREALSATQLSAHHLLDLVNDVLDAARIDAGEISIQIAPLDPIALLDHVAALLRNGANAKNLTLHTELVWPLPSRIRADGLRLKQVLVNLLSNAIKFTDHGSITLGLRTNRAAAAVEFSITDTGIGISAEQLLRLFLPFSQGDPSSARRYAGTGLGLYISRQLMERMGGTIAVTSEPEKGSCFRVRLPLDVETTWIEAQAPLAPIPAQHLPLRGKLRGRVLLAEDDELLREVISNMLADIGVETTVVNNGLEAIRCAQTQSFDLALLDMHMPVVDGADATQKLRANGFDRPILALTADVLPESIRAHLAAGVNEVLAKPITVAQLRNALGHYLSAELAPALQARLDGKLAEIRLRFSARQPEELAAMQAEHQRQDWPALKARLHRLKGSTGMLRLTPLNAAVRNAEAALNAGLGPQFELHFQTLCAQLQRDAQSNLTESH